MTELESKANRPNPGIVIIWTLAAALIGLHVIGPFGVLILYNPFYPGDFFNLLLAVQNILQHPELKMLLFVMQGAGTIIGLIIIPFFIRKWGQPEEKILAQPFYILPTILVIITVIAFMGLNSIFIEWNQNFKFPEALGGWEESLRAMEDQLTELSTYLTTFDSTTQVIVAFIVVAILPAIGEELVFRGVLQKELFRSTKNIHLSIWIAAAIFSAIHLQFYGFLPRMLLGALFGYLYYWSGNLTLSMLAHFVNNGFAVIGLYLYQQKMIDVDIDSTASWQAALFSALLTFTLLYLFRNFYRQKNINIPS